MTAHRLLIAAWLAVCGALPAAAASPAPAYSWHLDRNAVALGEPLTLVLERPLVAGTATLDQVDLRALDADFEVFSRTRGSDRQREELRLELYPRHPGAISLPLPGPPAGRLVTVRADDGVAFRLVAEPAAWVQRQPVRLVLEACVHGGLLWDEPQFPFVVGLGAERIEDGAARAPADGGDCVPRRWSWSVTPTLAGRITIGFPMLQATRFGRRLRFPLPSLQAEIRPVPAWLPPGLAVGPPHLRAAEVSAQPTVGQPVSWRLQLSGAYGEPTLRRLLRAQLAASPVWSRYPPEITARLGAGAAPEWEIRLYARPERSGPLALPRLDFPWFDPSANALRSVVTDRATITVIDPVRRRLALALAAAAGLGTLLAVGYTLRGRLRQRWLRWRLARRLTAARTPVEVRNLLLAETAPAAPRTLLEWAALCERHWRVEGLRPLVARIEAWRFSAAPPGAFSETVEALAKRIGETGSSRPMA